MPDSTPAALDSIPRLGWVDAPSPLSSLPEAAAELGLASLTVKRDDLLPALLGGSKVRKLDFLLAAEPWASAERWASVGAIGSGHLATLALAAGELGRGVDACCFWEPPSADALANLAGLASSGATLHYSHDRLTLALRRAGLLLGRSFRGAAAIPPGATTPIALLGLVRAGLELAEQVRAGELELPDRIYLPWGTGGTAVGLRVGLGLAGLAPEVVAVCAVERLLAGPGKPERMTRALLRAMEAMGLPLPADLRPAPLRLLPGWVGRGYGRPTEESCAACDWLAPSGIRLEPVYGGKAVAAMKAEAAQLAGRPVLYWLTSHRGELPRDPDWRGRLPPALARRLARAEGGDRGWTRRRLLVAGAAAVLGISAYRLLAYPASAPGRVLSARELQVVAAAAEAVIPEVAGPLPERGPTAAELAGHVDRYLTGMPPLMLLEVHGMLLLLEQGTGLNPSVGRLTRISPAARRRFLLRLASLGGLLGQAAQGIRDLVYLGWYQDPRTWGALGYGGPLVPRRPPGTPRPLGRYDALIAPPGASP